MRLPEASLQALYEARLALIRPDQIVAWRGHDAGDAARVLMRATGFRSDGPELDSDTVSGVRQSPAATWSSPTSC